MTPATLRRKLQKKAKRKPYRKCPECGGRTVCRVGSAFNLLNRDIDDEYVLVQRCPDCRFTKELFWSGGGTGRHGPH